MRLPEISTRNWIHSRVPSVLLVVALPPVLFLLGLSPLNQIGFLDPAIYTGYMHDYPGLMERYGITYYSTRIAFIFPGRFLVWLFGSQAGFLVFRWILLSGTLWALWAISRRFYGHWVALLMVVVFAFHPWPLRSLAWDYVDGFVITNLLVSLYFLIGHSSERWWRYALAGVFLGLAVNAYLFVIAVGGLFLIPWLYLESERAGARMGGLRREAVSPKIASKTRNVAGIK